MVNIIENIFQIDVLIEKKMTTSGMTLKSHYWSFMTMMMR